MSPYDSSSQVYTMRIQAAPGSPAELRYLDRTALASGLAPDPHEDLIFRGGKTVPQMEFQNIFLGSAGDWPKGNVKSIDAAITLAMRDKRLNNVMLQYFRGSTVTCDPRPHVVLGGAKPQRLDEPGVQAAVISLFDTGKITKTNLGTTIFNLALPPGTVLTLDFDTPVRGLGGYHGSVHIQRGGQRVTLYYSANVYSEVLPSGLHNGIPVFKDSWKNVVATLCHEINEFRTDPDVSDAPSGGFDALGWNARSGKECGDQPIVATHGHLERVFQEVTVANSTTSIPVQFMYSNAVLGAEGPIDNPHA